MSKGPVDDVLTQKLNIYKRYMAVAHYVLSPCRLCIRNAQIKILGRLPLWIRIQEPTGQGIPWLD